MTDGDLPTAAEGAIPALWKELQRIRERRKLSYGQLHIKLGGDATISIGTLKDRLGCGRKTSWEDMRPVVVALGQDAPEWKERFHQAQKQDKERCRERTTAPPVPANQMLPKRWWAVRRPRVLAGLAAGVLCLAVVVVIWSDSPGRSNHVQDVRCARVSDGVVRVYDEPGSRKHSFTKYEGQRIQVPIPTQEIVGSNGLRYRRVLTPSRRDGYGWILSNTANLTEPC